MSVDEEEYEQIPWSSLLAEHRTGRGRLALGASGVLVVAALVFGLVRWTSSGDVDSNGALLTVPAVEPAPGPPSTSTTSTVALLSEADLMASASPQVAPALIEMRAEWFITDYFTVDGEAGAGTELARAFVGDADLPPLPHVAEDPGGSSFVEWARAYDSTRVADGSYRVAVAFRSIFMHPDGFYARGPMRAASVVVVVGPDGAAAIGDLPMPLVPPQATTVRGWPALAGVPSDGVVAAGLDYAALFNESPRLVDASGSDVTWRLVVSLGDGSGIEWPVVIRSADLSDSN